MLGFTRHGITPISRQKSRVVLTWTLISFTIVMLSAMFDSYFFQRSKIYISPLQRQDKQNCAMTYSSPNYFEIAGVESKLAEKYKLYIYRDGYKDDNNVSSNNCQKKNHIINMSRVFKLYGVPALFIPGQAGSYGQIRSLASTTTNLYHQNSNQQKNIDFFTGKFCANKHPFQDY